MVPKMFEPLRFGCINICLIPVKLHEHENAGRGFKYILRDPAKFNAMEEQCGIALVASFVYDVS